MRGRLYVLSGPAGAGKGTVLQTVFSRLDNISYSVSCTTRAPRPGEVDGVHYHFMDDVSFRKMVDEGMFLEWADVHGHCYGTRKDTVDRALDGGSDLILEIDVQGAANVKSKMPEAVTIFITPPTFEELVRRLTNRGTESGTELELRIKNAEYEMDQAAKYQYLIINDTVDRAAEEFIKIVQNYRRGSR